eukprot:150907_1
MTTCDSYHDTISKMARKYSNCALADASEPNENILNETHFHPMEEIRKLQTDKALFSDIFDTYFDESKEGDVDFSEFKTGLFKLGYNNSDEEIQKLFNVLLMNDDVFDNNNKYLHATQFCDFLVSKFSNSQLCDIQKKLLNIIQKKTETDGLNITETVVVAKEEIEMRQVMEQMVDNEMEKIKMTQQFEQELANRISNNQLNVCNISNWDFYSVAHWLNKNDYNYCMKTFFDNKIDGNILLYDINTNMLSKLGVKTMHLNKLMRDLNKLKRENLKSMIPLEWNCEQVTHWLMYVVNMEKYVPQFMEQFIDGQILLNDINDKNLLYDLQIKSIHVPKIMREIYKLKNNMSITSMRYHCEYNVTNFNVQSYKSYKSYKSKQNTLILNRLKNDLLELQVQKNKAINVFSKHKIECKSPITKSLLPQPREELSTKWQKYIKSMLKKYRELKTKYREFQTKIEKLESQNKTRKKTIDKLNSRIQRKNETIDQLKQQCNIWQRVIQS